MRAPPLAPFVLVLWLLPAALAAQSGLLDGRSFDGRIGPAEAPDLADTLHFEDGHVWSAICAECGFRPGRYTATRGDDGRIAFTASMDSDSHGQFAYRGHVTPDGRIAVSIEWSRARWYWTVRRSLAFEGQAMPGMSGGALLDRVRARTGMPDPASNPRCDRL